MSELSNRAPQPDALTAEFGFTPERNMEDYQLAALLVCTNNGTKALLHVLSDPNEAYEPRKLDINLLVEKQGKDPAWKPGRNAGYGAVRGDLLTQGSFVRSVEKPVKVNLTEAGTHIVRPFSAWLL